MENQDTKTELDENLDGSTGEGGEPENQSADNLDYFESSNQEKAPDPKEEIRKKNRESLIKAEANKVLYGEKDLDDVPEWAKEEVGTIYNDIVAKNSQNIVKESDFLELKTEIAKVKAESDLAKAKTIFRDTLESYGISKQEFDKDYGQQFLAEIKILKDRGFSNEEATERALRYVGVPYHAENKKDEMVSRQMNAMTMPTPGIPVVPKRQEKISSKDQKLLQALQGYGIPPQKILQS